MKNILFALCISLFFSGCEKEDNVRDVVIEVEVDPITSGGVTFGLVLTNGMSEISVYEELEIGSARTFQSNQMAVDEGVTCYYDIIVLGAMDANGTIIGLPSDIEVKIKSDNKVIWSYKGDKGTGGLYSSNGTLVIR